MIEGSVKASVYRSEPESEDLTTEYLERLHDAYEKLDEYVKVLETMELSRPSY